PRSRPRTTRRVRPRVPAPPVLHAAPGAVHPRAAAPDALAVAIRPRAPVTPPKPRAPVAKRYPPPNPATRPAADRPTMTDDGSRVAAWVAPTATLRHATAVPPRSSFPSR